MNNVLKIFSILLLLMFFLNVYAKSCNKEVDISQFKMGIELSTPLEIYSIEKKELETIEKDGVSQDLPFGWKNNEWIELKSMFQLDDCIYFFTTNRKSWENLSGRSGYFLVREGKIIYAIITEVS